MTRASVHVGGGVTTAPGAVGGGGPPRLSWGPFRPLFSPCSSPVRGARVHRARRRIQGRGPSPGGLADTDCDRRCARARPERRIRLVHPPAPAAHHGQHGAVDRVGGNSGGDVLHCVSTSAASLRVLGRSPWTPRLCGRRAARLGDLHRVHRLRVGFLGARDSADAWRTRKRGVPPSGRFVRGAGGTRWGGERGGEEQLATRCSRSAAPSVSRRGP